VLEFAYRTGQSKYVHWGVFEEKMKAFDLRPRRGQLSPGTRLQANHLRSILSTSEVYTIPAASSVALQDAANADDIAEASRLLDVGAEGQFTVFQVLDLDVSRKKLMPNSELPERMRSMMLPARIQRLAVWRGSGDYPADKYEFCCEEDAEVVDLLKLAPWPIFRWGLRHWCISDESDTSGCLHAHGSICLALSEKQDDVDAMSALTCMETLLASGWASGHPPAMHTANSEKMFTTKDAVRDVFYMRCLLRLSDLLVNHPDGIPSGANQRVYRGILDEANGRQPRGNPRAESVWDSESANESDAVADVEMVDQVAEPDAEANSVFEDIADVEAPLPKRQRIAANADARKVGRAPRTPLVSCPKWPNPSSHDAHGVDANGSTPPNPSVNSQPSSNGVPAANADQVETGLQSTSTDPPQDAGQSTEANAEWRPLAMHLEEQRVTGDVNFGTDRRGQTYCRIIVSCPCAAHKGRKCQKKRNLGPAQCARFGQYEPYAFLGAWIMASARFATQAEHVKYEPTANEVEAYMVRKGWLDGVAPGADARLPVSGQ
jgi:hypothetical protein